VSTSRLRRRRDAARVLKRFGRVDILVNNAGKGGGKPMLDLTDDDWSASIELNLMSAVRLSLACVPHMRMHRFGRIVNISSLAAREPIPHFAPYSASKAALINFSKNLANASFMLPQNDPASNPHQPPNPPN